MITIKPIYEKVKNVCCAVASFLVIPMIIINITLIIQIYLYKETVPNFCGYFPIISFEDESSINIKKGDFIVCRKFDKDINRKDVLTEGKLVTHFADISKNTMCLAPFVSLDGDSAAVSSPRDEHIYKLSVNEVLGEYRFTIPLLGYVFSFLATIPGFIICVVIPTIVFTELYLYERNKDSSLDDEESILLAELALLKAERERLISKAEKELSDIHS